MLEGVEVVSLDPLFDQFWLFGANGFQNHVLSCNCNARTGVSKHSLDPKNVNSSAIGGSRPIVSQNKINGGGAGL